MPGDNDGVAVLDLHLPGAGSLRPGHAINAGDDVGDAVGVVGRQLAEDEAERPADKAEGDRLLDQQGAVSLGGNVDIEAVGTIAFVVLGGNGE